MVTWALSDAGTATATWIADIVAVVALAVALSVALVEQRRANADARKVETAAAQNRHQFLHTAMVVLTEADGLIVQEQDKVLDLSSRSDPVPISKLPYLIEPLLEALNALTHSAPREGDLVLTLSRSARLLRDIHDQRRVSQSESRDSYKAYLDDARAEILRRSHQLSYLMRETGPLPEELSILKEYR